MFRAYGLLSIAYVALFVYTVLDVILTDASLIRNLPKMTWVFLLIFLGPVGVLAWFVAGRPQGTTAGVGSGRSRGSGTGRQASTRGNPTRRPPPKGPDDDPAFLRSLDDRRRAAEPTPDPAADEDLDVDDADGDASS